MAICELEDTGRVYGTGTTAVRALDGVTVAFDAGEFTVISGPSGSGKTTMLNLIGLLDRPDHGRVRIEGKDSTGMSRRELAHLRANRIGFVFQSFNLIPVLSALENVELALQLAGLPNGGKAERMLDLVGLGKFLHRKPNELSGGQQQRVAIARALVKQPALVIADEPTANLDSVTGAQILDLMRDMNEEMQVTFLFSTHDHAVMERARRVVRLHDGRIVEDEARTPVRTVEA